MLRSLQKPKTQKKVKQKRKSTQRHAHALAQRLYSQIPWRIRSTTFAFFLTVIRSNTYGIYYIFVYVCVSMSTRRPSVKNHFVSNFATFARFSDVAIYVLTIRARIQE